jgi:hypothetical protein
MKVSVNFSVNFSVNGSVNAGMNKVVRLAGSTGCVVMC